jgi:outer membrane translocation and assembly module TamA
MGVGLRYVTPVGPLAFDLGVNLDPDDALNEPATQLHFSIGTF